MKKFKKILLWFLAIIIVLIVAVMLGLGAIIKKTVNSYGSEITQTEVELKGLSISLLGLDAEMKDFVIGSPKGFTAPYVFKLGDIEIDVDTSTVTKDVIVINKIAIADVGVFYELMNGTSNLSVLNDNISGYFGGGAKAAKPAAKPASKSSASAPAKKVMIKELSITGAEVSIAAGLMGKSEAMTLKLPDMFFQNIGDPNKGEDFGKALALLLEKFTVQTMKEVTKSSLNEALKLEEKSVDSLKKGFKSLFGN